MISTPVWQGATTGHAGNAGHVNQFIGTHQTQFVYDGVLQSSQTTGSGFYTSTQGLYTSQIFTTTSTQTTLSTVQLQLSTVGGSPTLSLINPIVVGIYATAGNIPTGSALVLTQLPCMYVYSSSFWVTVPLPLTGLGVNTPYAIVTYPVGTSTNYYALQHSDQTSGTYTSTDGATWTAQTYGLMYRIYDGTGPLSGSSGSPSFIYDDNSAQITRLTYNANGSVSSILKQTITQDGTYFQSSRSFSYTNGLLTGVS